ncbi:glutamine-dependent NAD(+) synthetase [Clydaea vesicula]|uniref:Glutamine-dependent NAD(+) synthetase n=1 Tax=Clydaea vesicula TaxID=447962 RepID=A0AAD5XYM7_9FUNG|nr:glutamine-dependent NAD(+) synthetase [Clydaea vesicula]
MKKCTVEDFFVPSIISEVTNQLTVPFGDGVIATLDPHVSMALDGVEIITNASGSHHEFRKLSTRVDLMKSATKKVACGGIYIYANHQGCDGERVYYDGSCMIFKNGECVAQGSQFSLSDVVSERIEFLFFKYNQEVQVATIDLEEIRAFRSQNTSRSLYNKESVYPRIRVDFQLSVDMFESYPNIQPTIPVSVKYHTPEQEIRFGPACWMWDYLRRSKSCGFFLPLSGGIDSCATALLVFSMSALIVETIANGDLEVLADVRNVVFGDSNYNYTPVDAREFCGRLLNTCYLGTVNSSFETRDRATRLAKEIGSYHLNTNIDSVVSAVVQLFALVTKKTPTFKLHGGSEAENLALQNIQARLRMVMSYLFAQLLPWVKGTRPGGLLVLGSANVDETLRGYLTKYDCSSADINPIGGISKIDLRKFIEYARTEFNFSILEEFLNAPATAELEPITEDYVQEDEVDMGFTYQDLSVLGTLRKVDKLGPFGMFSNLLFAWKDKLSPLEVLSNK